MTEENLIKSLLNKANVRRYIKEKLVVLRPGWNCKLISSEAIEQTEAKLRNSIDSMIQSHPTKGKTFKP